MCRICRLSCDTVALWLRQGGKPSPFDRNLGTKLGAKAVERLIQQIGESKIPTGIKIMFYIHVKCFTTVNKTDILQIQH